IPSRIIASSLARNSTDRAPCSTRGSLKTPSSSRLYHSTKPSRSHTRIFNRSPRRERNTNRWPLCGFSPMTARPRSASRSNPQRMSVASLAIQIRAPCARSIACKLGSPITPPPPLPPTMPAHARHRIRASPSGFAHSSVGFQRSHRQACSAPAPPLALPGTLSACVPPAASSIRKSTAGTNLALDKTLSHSVRYVPARKPAFATSSRLSLSAWSCRNIALRRESLQDAVRVALTKVVGTFQGKNFFKQQILYHFLHRARKPFRVLS